MRIRREFSEQFKRSAVQRLATASVAEVAQACGVSVSVLHRWRRQLGNYRAVALAGSRRQFPKEFKAAAVRRLEQGESVREVVRACQLDPSVLRRWWQEWRRYGETAFLGYGKPRAPARCSRTVVVRFTEEEYARIQCASLARRARSLPDFVRAQVLSPAPSIAEIDCRLKGLVCSVRRAANDFLLWRTHFGCRVDNRV